MIKKDVIIACDFPSWEKTKEFLNLFSDEKPFVKIGMELFYTFEFQSVFIGIINIINTILI